MKSVMWIFVCVTLQFCFSTVSGRGCTLPNHWRGKWINNVMTTRSEIQIKDSVIHGIGQCVDQSRKRDTYLMYDENEDCYRCILVIERHTNVIQYKQSYCKPMREPEMKSTCGDIKVETPLHTLVRVGGHPLPCPFSRMKAISLETNSNTLCENSRSQVQTCASEKKMKFTFASCPDMPETKDLNSEFEVECLAKWKDGSNWYLYTSLTHQSVDTGNSLHRCFSYQSNHEYSSEIWVSMSLDANCITYKKIKLTEDTEVVGNTCSFAKWVQGPSWLHTSGKVLSQVVAGGKQLVAKRLKETASIGRITHKYTCMNNITSTNTTQVLMVKSVHKCTSSYQCLKLQLHTDHVLELIEGSKSHRPIKNCDDAFSNHKHIHSTSILIKKTESARCPIHGTYKTVTHESHSSGKCQSSSVHIGCRKLDTLTIYSRNSNAKDIHDSDEYNCLQQWKSGGKQYLIGRQVKNKEFKCLVYDTSREHPIITINDNCQSHRGNTCKVTDSRDLCPGRSGKPKPREEGSPINKNQQEQHVVNQHSTNSVPSQFTSYSRVVIICCIFVSYVTLQWSTR